MENQLVTDYSDIKAYEKFLLERLRNKPKVEHIKYGYEQFDDETLLEFKRRYEEYLRDRPLMADFNVRKYERKLKMIYKEIINRKL